ncbi:hypothetical protein Clacol_005574 [Clathrus columnatus]|uniref:Uncharacterized protein n=1 Tax=Clathrus columnatus TaxID=1419009 RepID=A0AAV5A9P6_9AGAM|nr:hypothetical protein Clacol_005574 [Clathrus columnatus]
MPELEDVDVPELEEGSTASVTLCEPSELSKPRYQPCELNFFVSIPHAFPNPKLMNKTYVNYMRTFSNLYL